MRFVGPLLLSLLLSVSFSAAADAPYFDLEGTGTFELPGPTDTSRAAEIYVEDARRFEIVEDPRDPAQPTWHRGLWLSYSTFPSTAPSFAFESCIGPVVDGECPGTSGSAGNYADRLELTLDNWSTGNDAEELKLDRRRYIGFRMFFGGETEVPTNWTLVHQVWQLDSAGRSPPFAIFVRENPQSTDPANDPIELRFVIRNDQNHSAGGLEVYRYAMPRREWHHIIVQLQPSAIAGQLAIWIDKPTTAKADQVWYGPWGYAPNATISNEFDLRVGIYRRQQARRLKVLFDEIRVGATGASVDDPAL